MQEYRICGRDEIPDGGVRIVDMGDLEIGVIRQGGKLYAYRNLCPHQGGPACEGVRMPRVFDNVDADGRFIGQEFDEGELHIVCPWHGYEYRLSDGVNVCDAQLKLRKYEVEERDDDVFLRV
ncbi:Rieske (2Fe-2S) protein [Oricola sp.]|uniref:Rieske (2Fe-2S) protein n=1 Tax=Oricola sp. TaxID=1979950 RepID=UPI0025DB30A2|nr:Rieske (2Fe-2S) protein [Oricola sp.]MCI5074519.1 Rieske (2Fe-2S) protein [Oricola sp.]